MLEPEISFKIPFQTTLSKAMKKLFSLFLLLLVVWSCKTTEKDPVVSTEKYSIDQFYKNKNIFGGSFSSDEKSVLVTSNETDIFNVFALPVDGSEARHLCGSSAIESASSIP